MSLSLTYSTVKREHEFYSAANGVFTLICDVHVKRQEDSNDIMGPSSGSVRSGGQRTVSRGLRCQYSMCILFKLDLVYSRFQHGLL